MAGEGGNGCHSPMCQKLQDERYHAQEDRNHQVRGDIQELFRLVRGTQIKIEGIVGAGVALNLLLQYLIHCGIH